MIISLSIVMDSLPHLNSEDDFSFEFNTQMIDQYFGPVVNVPTQSVNEGEEDDVQIIYDRLGESIEQQQITPESPLPFVMDGGYSDYLNDRSQQQQPTSPECAICESVVFTSHYLTQLNRIAAQCSCDETTDHNRGACESGVDIYDYLAQQAAQCSWNETLDHYRHYHTSPMVNRPCLFVSADDILKEREDSPLLTNAYQYELSQYNAHHGHAQISYRGRIYIPIGVERDYLREQNQISSQDLFTQSSEESEQENWMAEFIQDRPEDIKQNHLQYIQQQIEDDSSQNDAENWMEEFIQDRPFYV
uniref:Uncharacterized protein n=1 Tax=Trichogramma kaykai TaxID=54128 RepID=A0ABD2WI51_9HYME